MRPIAPPPSDGAPPICHMFTRSPSRLMAAGATTIAPIMLSTVTTLIPSAIESRIVPGDSRNATAVIASSTRPAKFAVRPAVLAAIDAAWRGTWPAARLSRNRVTISSE